MAIYDIHGNVISGGENSYFQRVFPLHSNLYDPAVANENKKLNSSGDLVSLAGSTTSDFVDVGSHVGKYVIPQYGMVGSVNPDVNIVAYPYYTYLAFYDASKKMVGSLVSATNGDYTVARAPVLIPSGTKYMRCSWNISYGGVRSCEMWQLGVFVVDTIDGTTEFEPYYPPGAEKSAYIEQKHFRFSDAPALYGKKWTLFGDSLTDSFGGHDWQKSTYSKGEYGTVGASTDVPWTDYFFASKIAREFGLTLDNRAKSGSNMCVPMASQYKPVCGIYMLDAFLDEIDNGAEQPEIITIAFGTNCYPNHVGESTDTSETVDASYYGATRYFIENLREHCPKSSFGFVLPPVCDWGSDTKQEGVPLAREAIRSVCESEGVPYIDMAKESGITTAMLPDGVHISSHQANNLYYHAMRRFVMGL